MRKATLTRQQGMRGFIIATVAFVGVFAASAVPVPLYSAYQAQFGLSNMDLTIMLLAYLAGVISMLLVFGRVSNAVGRKPIVRIALASSLIGCVLLMLADGAPMLYTGRLFQGIACGIGMGNVASSAIDCIAEFHLSWGSIVSATCPQLGLLVGSLGSGLIYGIVPSYAASYGFIIAVLAASLVSTIALPETVAEKDPLGPTLKPNAAVPPAAKVVFPLAAVVYSTTWTVGSFFQSYSAPIATVNLHTDSTLIAALILSFASLTVLGGPIASRFRARTSLLIGMGCFISSNALLIPFVSMGSMPGVFFACLVFSLSMGIGTSTTLRLLLRTATAAETAPIVSAVNLAAYVFSTIMNTGAGALTEVLDFPTIFAIFTVFAVATTAYVIFFITSHYDQIKPAGQNADESA